jgi:FtsH-binding integral membrane protein
VRLYQRSATRRPDPEPLRTNDRVTIWIGIALWAVALVVTLVLRDRLIAAGNGWWTWTTLAGIALGFVGLAYVRRQGRTADDR